MNLKYLLGALIAFPLLPILRYQGNKLKKTVPILPEATGTRGSCKVKNSSKNPLKLITLGESTIAGVGVKTHEEGFTGMLAKQLSELNEQTVHWKVYARSGYTASRITEEIVTEISDAEADLIVIGIGGNDAFTLNTPTQWRADVKKLIDTLRTKFPEVAIVFCNMPAIKEFPVFPTLIKFTLGNLVEILGEELSVTIKNYSGVYYHSEVITLRKWMHKVPFKTQKSDFFSDGMHPSKLTYQVWATEVAKTIVSDLGPSLSKTKN